MVAVAKRWLVLYDVNASSPRYCASVTPGPCHDSSVDAAHTHAEMAVLLFRGVFSYVMFPIHRARLWRSLRRRVVELALCGTRTIVRQCSPSAVRRDVLTKVQRVVNIMIGISIYTKMHCCNMPFDKDCHLARRSSPVVVAWSCATPNLLSDGTKTSVYTCEASLCAHQ
jgi:hypothetical protein